MQGWCVFPSHRPPLPATCWPLQADVVTVSTLISCCERLGDWRRAQEVWDWMMEQVGSCWVCSVVGT